MSVTPLHPGPPPSLFDATVELFDAGQEVVVQRIEMLRAEIRHDLEQVVLALAAIVGAVAVALWGYAFIVVAITWALARVIDPPLAVAAIGATHFLIGAGLVAFAIRRFRSLAIVNDPEDES